MTLARRSSKNSGSRGFFLEECWRLAAPNPLGSLGGSGVAPPEISSATPATPELPQTAWGRRLVEDHSTDSLLPQDSADSAREHHFQERLAIANELETDTSPGSPAWETALREALRVEAGVPYQLWTRSPSAIDTALKAFQPIGGLTFISAEMPEPDPSCNPGGHT